MAKIYYDNPNSFGGTLVAKLAADAIQLKADAQRLVALLKTTTVDGNSTALIETGGTHGSVFQVAAGQGATMYQTVSLLATALNSVSSDLLADIDLGR